MYSFYIVFLNSLQSALFFTLTAEYGWFAAKLFGHSVLWITLAAIAGSTAGMGINFVLGYWFARRRVEWFRFGEANYIRVSKYLRRYFIWLLLFAPLPLLGLFALVTGLFRVPAVMVLGVVALGRIGYYSYYLLQ